jgi:hypothetical protein
MGIVIYNLQSPGESMRTHCRCFERIIDRLYVLSRNDDVVHAVHVPTEELKLDVIDIELVPLEKDDANALSERDSM